MEIGVNEMEFAVYAYSILATLLVGFLSVISASIVDKKTLIALCIISGSTSNYFFRMVTAPSGDWLSAIILRIRLSDIDMY